MRKTLLFLIVTFLSLSAVAQDRMIRGTVKNAEDGSVLPGVSVAVLGTAQGTVTDVNGAYQILVPATSSTLVFTFIGMIEQRVEVGSRSNIDVILQPDVKQLSEIVVVGYGTEQKELMTGSVGVVKADAIKDLPVPGIDGVLQGQVSGVQVSQNSGSPGGGMSVRVRGVTSLNGSNNPLYVIDGIPVITGDYALIGYEGQGINALTDLNANEIESISVLKDASAAAMYGSRASNGVVLITTKRGKSEKTEFGFNAYYGVQEAWRKLDMLNASDWMRYRNDLTGSTVFTEEQIANPEVNVDWQDVIFRQATIQNYEVFASGGSEKTKFYISLNHFDQEGILIGTQYKRSNFRLNLDHKANDKFSFGTSIGLNYSTTDRVEGDQSLHGVLPNGISTPAVISVFNPDGTYNQSGPYSNALSIANEATNKNFTYRGIANIFADYNIVPGLKFSTKWGIDFYNLREHAFEFNTVQGQRYNGLGFETFRNVTSFVSNNILNYTTSFGDHNLEALVGYSFEKTQSRYIYIRGQDYASEYLQYLSSASTFVSPTANASDKGLESYFGKANYNYQGKYLASLSARIDGSSNFGDNNKYGFFPAASLGWRISEEAFFKDNLSNVISEFKLKTSYGRLGNDAASPSQFMRLYGTYIYDGKPAIYPSNIPNPDLKWETTDQFDIGLETSFFDGKINFSIEYYNKQTRDLLQGRPIPPTTGFTSIMENIGRLENKGVEVNLGGSHMFGDVKWTSNLNVTVNRNKVLELYGGQPIDDLGRGGNRVMEGQPIGIFYSYKWLGVDPSTGDVVYDDIDRDGVITTDDRTIVGNANPKFFGGWTNTFNYKGFDLSVFLQFVYGNDVYNGSRMYLESLQGGDNQLAVINDRWREPGDITNIPRATLDGTAAAWNKRVSSRFLEDGSYLRVKNVTFGYSFHRDVIGRLGLRTLRLYASAQNLFTFTKYSGLDPEVNYRGNDTSVIGTDFFTFPQARAITFGINAKF